MVEFKEFPIALGLGCAVGCPQYCPQSTYVPAYKKLGGETLMTPALLEKYLRTVPKDSILVFSGFSEPFLNPHFTEILRKCHADGWQMRLDTTLSGCSKESAELVKAIPWKMLKLHLPSQGDKMRVSVTEEYLATLKTVVSGSAFKCFVYFGIPYPQIKAITDAVPEPKDYYCYTHGRAGNVRAVPYRSGKLKRCLWLDRGHLLPNGKIAMCCEDWSLKHILGDLNHENYADIFEKPYFKQLLAAHEDESIPLLCRNCNSGYYPDDV